MAKQRSPKPPLKPPERELIHGKRRIAIRESDAGSEVHIDGVPVDVTRAAPGRFHTPIFPFQEFPTAEELAKALVDTEGKLWLLPKPGDAGGSGGRHGK